MKNVNTKFNKIVFARKRHMSGVIQQLCCIPRFRVHKRNRMSAKQGRERQQYPPKHLRQELRYELQNTITTGFK